jgi:hypothetical protein
MLNSTMWLGYALNNKQALQKELGILVMGNLGNSHYRLIEGLQN